MSTVTTTNLLPVLRRSYDTTQDYFINVSTPCSPHCAPAGVRLEVAVFASLCQYFSESEKQWRTDGMVPLAETNTSRIVCRTRHLTAFGGGVFVPINAISFRVPVSTTQKQQHAFFVHIHHINTHFNPACPFFCRSAPVHQAWLCCWCVCWAYSAIL